MRNFLAFYNVDSNKILEQHKKETAMKENKNFIIYLSSIGIVVEDRKPTVEETQTFNKAWNHPDPIS